MFAVVSTGSKQYMVKVGSVIKAEKIEVAVGEKVVMQNIVLFGDGERVISGSAACSEAKVAVECQVLEQKKDKKVIIFKKKRRHNYRRKRGHRQNVTVLRVVGMSAA